MNTPNIAPYGTWRSPITAAEVAAGTHAVEASLFVGDEVWWSERRPSEGGRTGVFRRTPAADAEPLLPAPWSARSRVHEYGGGAWTATDDARLIWVDASDQRIRLLVPGAEPIALTPVESGTYGDLVVAGGDVLAVRERIVRDRVERDIVAVPLDGSAADDASLVLSMVGGSDFLAYPTPSPDGRHLAWIAWDHPNMPWDGTELRIGELSDDGVVRSWRTAVGGTEESVLQPRWRDAGNLTVLTDRTGWWNPASVDLEGVVVSSPVVERETGGPLWNLGARWYLELSGGDLLLRSTLGDDRIERLDSRGARTVIETPFTSVDLHDASGSRVLLHGSAPGIPGALVIVDLGTGAIEQVRSDYDRLPSADHLPLGSPRTFETEAGPVHAIVYPPRNPDFAAPEGERPPYVAFVHGGPTANASSTVNPAYAYYTSRGIGVIDVNYAGSTGYGRAYRERLDGAWGVADVRDVESAARALAESGEADPARLGIEGSSAGGLTVLTALISGSVFSCGVSLYGVADLAGLVASTHDFEAHYLDRLIGPLPASEDVYAQRSPLASAQQLRKPVLLLQGLDDPVVPPAQSQAFRDALVDAGVPHAYLEFEGESHGFRRADTRTRVRESALSFYGQVWGFTPPDVPRLPLWREETA